MRRNLRTVIRKLDYSQTEQEIESREAETLKAIENESYDFSSYKKSVYTKNGRKRIIYSFDTVSIENIICHYLKKEVDNVFHIKYASRSKIMTLFFNTLPAIRDMNDFVIVRVDFKDFFNSIYTQHVFEKYIQNSSIRRADKDLLQKYTNEFKFCYAGLCLSNGMAEIVCRDFDHLIKAKLEQYGLFFYERYVDDMLIMLKAYIDKDSFLQLFEDAIKDVFGKCPVKISMKTDKFSFITCRDLQQTSMINKSAVTEPLSFLGYDFFINYAENDKKPISFRYGISKKKRDRYKHLIEPAFIEYKNNGNIELFRQRLKIFSARTVVPRSVGSKRIEWLTNGITSHYGELRYHLDDLDLDTEKDLKEMFSNLFDTYGIAEPYFMKNDQSQNSIYNLYSCLRRNRSIIFDKRIGVQRADLVRWIKKINPFYREDNKRYYQLVMEYFELLAIK